MSLLCCNLIINGNEFGLGVKLLGLALLAIFGIGTMGHIINDWNDIADDRKAGKPNTMELITVPYRWLMFMAFVVLGYLPWFIGFMADETIVFLLGLEAVLFMLYSVPPVKLKKIPLAAICLDSLYAFVVPSLFLWFSFDSTVGVNTNFWLVASIIGWTFPMGLRHVLLHHITDRNNDMLSSIPNLANLFGVRAILQTTRWILVPVEMLFHMAFLFQLFQFDLIFGVLLMVIYGLLMISVLVSKLPYLSLGLAKLPLDTYYTKFLGIACLLGLSISNPEYLMVLVVFLLLFTHIKEHPLWRYVIQQLANQLWSIGSLSVNWGVYYFRKWMLNWSEERNWGRFYAKHLREAKLDERPSIAMFNQSYGKFSSDYLVKKFSRIEHRLFFYYGYPRPIQEKETGHLMGKNDMLRRLRYTILNFINADIVDIENEQVSKSLLKKKTDLIIAHSAAIGSDLLEVVKKTGIPLLLIINETDSSFGETNAQNRSKILELYSNTKCVIGTSKEICKNLELSGCPKEKIEYLPSFLDPDLLTLESKGSNGNVFITVGRYYSTRAPYLLLLSFRELVNEQPDAELLILGLEKEDDVTEVCRVMTLALGLKDHVKFLYNCSYSEVVQAMMKADVFVQHFVTTTIQKEHEGTSIAVMMAMAMGLPVVSTRNGGIAELIENGRTGLLVEELDYLEMAQQMKRIASDLELRMRIIDRAKKYINEEQRISSGVEVFGRIVNRCVHQKQYIQLVPRMAQ